jgi:L-threonylcarbamoyladenylate synthase
VTSAKPATPDSIQEAATLLRAGRLVAFPTETVYGLGADATNGEAVAAIFAAKNRPDFNPLIIHVQDAGAAPALVSMDDRARRLADRFWPGALTLVLPRTENCPVSLLAGAGLDTLAVRVPAHPTAQALMKAAAIPIAAPSANRSGEVSPTAAEHVVQSLGDTVDLIIDDGPCLLGVESTILDLSGPSPVLLRPGSVTEESLIEMVGPLGRPAADSGSAPRSPGLLARHYATRIPLRMKATEMRQNEALLAFGPAPISGAAVVENLSPTGDLAEAAANLFAMMRVLDRPDFTGIAVMPIPEEELGAAINDRLRRAAHD